jgi:transposase-like protein
MPEVGARPATRRSYSQGFRDQAVAYVLDMGQVVSTVAGRLDIPASTLRGWVARAPKLSSPASRTEILQLQREFAEARQERDDLRRAARTWFG